MCHIQRFQSKQWLSQEQRFTIFLSHYFHLQETEELNLLSFIE